MYNEIDDMMDDSSVWDLLPDRLDVLVLWVVTAFWFALCMTHPYQGFWAFPKAFFLVPSNWREIKSWLERVGNRPIALGGN